MQNTTYNELSESYKILLDEAEKVMFNAYNPYSNFFVGAALLVQNNKIVTGTNFECAAYGEIICAEKAAIVSANAQGIRKFEAIAIIGKGKAFEAKEVVVPCGGCRQLLYEFSCLSNNEISVIMSSTKKDKIVISDLKELLPKAFGPQDLGIDLAEYRK